MKEHVHVCVSERPDGIGCRLMMDHAMIKLMDA